MQEEKVYVDVFKAHCMSLHFEEAVFQAEVCVALNV